MFDLNEAIVEKLSDAIVLSYDKVNSRISVTMLFPEPVCVHVSITFKGRKIPNGDFDVIVLSSSDTTLVHKNISKRNICYEAKLVNVFSQQTKSKPRKVVCYIGPKQVRSLNQKNILNISNKFIENKNLFTDYDKRENPKIYSEANCHLSLMSFNKGMQFYARSKFFHEIITLSSFLLHFSSFFCHRLISISMVRFL